MNAEIVDDARPSSPDHVGSLAKGLIVLELLARSGQGMTLTEVAQELSLTRAGARRLLITLATAGYAIQNGRRFSLSTKLLSLSRTWLSGVSLWTSAEPSMREVATALGESCSAAVLAGMDVVYVARVAGARITSVALQVGTRLPAHCTSMGRALLSGMSDQDLSDFLSRATLERRTAKTIVDPSKLAVVIGAVAIQGFAVVDEELEIGLRSIAVPIRDRTGRVVAAINVSAQSSSYSVSDMERKILPLLKRAAVEIENVFVVQ